MPDDKKAALHPAYRDTRYHTAQIEITGRKMRSLPELGNQCQLCFSETIQTIYFIYCYLLLVTIIIPTCTKIKNNK